MLQKIFVNSLLTDRKLLVCSILLIGSFFFCFAGAVTSLISAWRFSYIYSYGFLVPIISLYLIWDQSGKLKNIRPQPSYFPGVLILLAGAALLLIGTIKGGTSIKGFSLITAIIGLILLLLGMPIFKVVRFPVLYLIFMVPFWDNITARLQLFFQIFSATTGTWLLQLIGIPVYGNSVYIFLPHITLEVAKECSGVNQLIAVIAIAVPLSYLSLNTWQRRLILILGSTVIAAFGNAFRIAIIGVLSYFGQTNVLHGPYHLLEAMSTSFLGFIVLFFLAWLLSRNKNSGGASGKLETAGLLARDLPSEKYRKLLFPMILTTGLFLSVGIYVNFFR